MAAPKAEPKAEPKADDGAGNAAPGAPLPAGCPLVVGLMGPMESGKDTVADMLVALNPAFARMSFAECLRTSVEILTKGVVPASKTHSSADKASMVPVGAFGDTLGEAISRVCVSIGMALSLEIKVVECLSKDGKLDEKAVDLARAADQSADQSVVRSLGSVTVPRALLVTAVNILTGLELSVKNGNETPVAIKKTITVGRLLQLFGTEVGRNLFHEDIWVLALEREWCRGGRKALLMTDTRFGNEIDFLEGVAGHIYYIDADERLAQKAEESKTASSGGRSTAHASKTALRKLRHRATGTIPNNGMLKELAKHVTEILWPRLNAPAA